MEQSGQLTFNERVFKGDYLIRIVNGEEVLGETEVSIEADSMIS